jgi:deoxycytidylate deaminase
MFDHILKLALELASTKAISDCAHRHAAIIFDRKGRIYSVGYNVEQVNDRAGRYHKYFCWHAESLAISRLPKTTACLTLLSIRLNKQAQLRNAKPCLECQALIKKSNIHTLYYSDAQGQIVRGSI